jgi:hypothetical protein
MDYNQKIQNDANEIQHLSDAFEEVRVTLDILTSLETTGIGNRLAYSIQKVVYQALAQIDAIECKINQCYTEKE